VTERWVERREEYERFQEEMGSVTDERRSEKRESETDKDRLGTGSRNTAG
jgi:hypothetical protein